MIDPSHVHGANWQPTPGCPFCSCARYGQVITKQLSNAQLVVNLADVYENDLQKGSCFCLGAIEFSNVWVLRSEPWHQKTLCFNDIAVVKFFSAASLVVCELKMFHISF